MISTLIQDQRSFFHSNGTRKTDFRLKQLKLLKQILQSNEAALNQAIYADFGKSAYETYLTELSFIHHEIDLVIKNLKSWTKRQRVKTPLVNFPAKSYIIPEPYGNTLIISAWNYPYQLSLIPAVSALAAGNTVILKPSEIASNTSQLMAKLINENFHPGCFAVVEGDARVTSQLLEHRFNKIFFTGSTRVGQIVYEAAARHMCPVTLELGGKNPTFVLKDTDIEMTARRIVWAKFLNSGQTCIAPDYLLVEKEIESKFLAALETEINARYDFSRGLPGNYTRIINERNFDRLLGLIDNSKVISGGGANREQRIIYPTILYNIGFDDTIMQEEIFGPLLPVITFDNLSEIISLVKQRPKPLACYVYSKNRKCINSIISELSFGGGAVNDSMMQVSNPNLPFGGVGMSGIGSYHGKAGFNTFSHQKSIFENSFLFDLPMKYLPFTKLKMQLLRMFIGR